MYVLPCNFKDFQKKLYVNSLAAKKWLIWISYDIALTFEKVVEVGEEAKKSLSD